MKILNITKTYEKGVYGGVEYLIDIISKNAIKFGIISDVFTLKKRQTKKTQYKVFSEKEIFNILSTPISIKFIISFIKLSKKYDIINFHFPWPMMDLVSFFIPSSKIIITYHADITQRNILYYLYFPIMIIFLYRSKNIIVTSENFFKNSKLLKKFEKKIIVIPIGINRLSKLKKPKDFLKLGSIKNNYFIFVGNVREYKGLPFLIDAFKKIKCNLCLVLSGDKRKKFQGFLKNIKNIKLFYSVSESEKMYLIKNSLGLILPSIDRREAFGIVLLEGASQKKPLLTTNIKTGTSYININKKTGFVLKPRDSGEIIKYCNILLNDKKLRKKMGNAAFNRYKRLFTKEIMIKNYVSFFKNF